MQTIYYTTSNFIRHTGNVIDLAEYRRHMEFEPQPSCAPTLAVTVSRPAARKLSRKSSRFSVGLFLDFCASSALLVLTVGVLARFLTL
ncbi:hypothetical protein SDC9_59628 [bioreactor metagenome]|uniref:Uncharacterized protein n=1 Tax=bioreactor metagenome TaxID=1076179 RepID=A0A644XAN8_9ZZZZ